MREQIIMWMYIDNGNYFKAAIGVAISIQPLEGPFDYMGSIRPHGCESRDMAISKMTTEMPVSSTHQYERMSCT